MSVKPGDLVRLVKNPRVSAHIIPKDERPVGIVVKVFERLIGEEHEPQAYMKIVEVFWSDARWNHVKGISEEYAGDLEVL